MKGKLYLIPSFLGDEASIETMPAEMLQVINKTKYYIVENVRTARRFLSKMGIATPINELVFYELNKHTDPMDISGYLDAARQGNDIGVISEAGCPGVADPGADVVILAHNFEIEVVPLIGPSSILLALMASGMNGQKFAFQGYIPLQKTDRIRKLKDLERLSARENQTQIMIETPFRNQALFQDIISNCAPETLFCVAADVSLPTQYIKTQPIKNWKNSKLQLQKRPAVFLLLASKQ